MLSTLHFLVELPGPDMFLASDVFMNFHNLWGFLSSISIVFFFSIINIIRDMSAIILDLVLKAFHHAVTDPGHLNIAIVFFVLFNSTCLLLS